MKYPVYSYRDQLVGFGAPILEISDQTAMRGFSMQMNNPNDLKNFSPKDFDLYKIGIFDSETGYVEAEKIPVLICSGTSVLGD